MPDMMDDEFDEDFSEEEFSKKYKECGGFDSE